MQNETKRVDELSSWLFHLFHGDIIPKTNRPAICLAFSSGCLLHASGQEVAGAFICRRALSEVIKFVPGSQAKSQEVIKRLPGHEERFARSASSNLEINKAFVRISQGEDDAA
ncbi:hypothetical protein [Algicola sagamiensis]|uniref:hypothetical protein n=1 Tax=Algicola sagamiensis TaxID=163869 RepID=UPI00036A76CE|nr:hypothetical protein [Algicola sagamiensis]